MKTRVKICGITNREDANFCGTQGVDAIGLVFYPKSSRYVTPEQARAITIAMDPFVSIVGLFMNATDLEIRDITQSLHLDMLQFHGQESGVFCEQFQMPYIKAIPMGEQGHDFTALAEEYTHASGFLLDSHSSNTPGGTGSLFNWENVPQHSVKNLILAGGLTPDNVQSAVRAIHPYAVDCSSGVEAEPGVKDHAKIRKFMEKVADV